MNPNTKLLAVIAFVSALALTGQAQAALVGDTTVNSGGNAVSGSTSTSGAASNANSNAISGSVSGAVSGSNAVTGDSSSTSRATGGDSASTSRATGGEASANGSVSTNVSTKVRAPAYAPGLATGNTTTISCKTGVGGSLGAAGVVSLGIAGTEEDEECTLRENIKIVSTIDRELAREMMMDLKGVRAAMGRLDGVVPSNVQSQVVQPTATGERVVKTYRNGVQVEYQYPN